eukprot:gene22952-9336_t
MFYFLLIRDICDIPKHEQRSHLPVQHYIFDTESEKLFVLSEKRRYHYAEITVEGIAYAKTE